MFAVLDYFVLVLFAFVVSGLVLSVGLYYVKRLAGKNVSEMICFVSSET